MDPGRDLPEISKRIPGLRPGILWTELRPGSTRGKKRAGLRPGPSGRERICRKSRFLHRKMIIFEKLRFWCPGPPKSTSGPSFSDSPRQTIWGPEVLVQIRALRASVVTGNHRHPHFSHISRPHFFTSFPHSEIICKTERKIMLPKSETRDILGC